jgi:hypothetical protein
MVVPVLSLAGIFVVCPAVHGRGLVCCITAVFTIRRNASCSPKGICRVIRNLRRGYIFGAFQGGTEWLLSFRFGAPFRDEIENRPLLY